MVDEKEGELAKKKAEKKRETLLVKASTFHIWRAKLKPEISFRKKKKIQL